jgi:hypothetical protein
VSAVVRNLPSASLFAIGIIGETVSKCLEPGCNGVQNACFLHGDWATCWCDTCGAEVRVPVRRPASRKEAREFDRMARERVALERGSAK